MYIPKHFEVTDPTTITDFIKANSFAILFSHAGRGPFATHLPLILDEEKGDKGHLLGHMARANPQWQWANGSQVLVVFHGSHAYVSPTWYQDPDTVPTWNYAAVHVTGLFKAEENGAGAKQIMGQLVDYFESGMPNPWQPDYDSQYVKKMLKGIVPFRIQIQKMEGKWKLNQNHPVERRQRVIDVLGATPDQNAQEIARVMRAHLQSR